MLLHGHGISSLVLILSQGNFQYFLFKWFDFNKKGASAMDVEIAKKGPEAWVTWSSGWCTEHQSSFGNSFYRQNLCHSLPLRNDWDTVVLEGIPGHECQSYLGMSKKTERKHLTQKRWGFRLLSLFLCSVFSCLRYYPCCLLFMDLMLQVEPPVCVP